MAQAPEIKVERQSGGWVWAAVLPGAHDGVPIVLGQSTEAFATEEAALLNAETALPGLWAEYSKAMDKSRA
ncbi:hypothetical protein QCE63_17180 [Caballeronia sp. LZ065]|uniref:hypothetical protein n=1 Tax=Caballeronia sp. LZ065 TaxID=3038571 RepID=UPI002866AEEF|nr:hypothetical protein [Caballeronia sp. LZ065]MDR5781157.1 hypothetical protein [Caballeronia sp. LZ065]